MLKAIAKRYVKRDHWLFMSWYRQRFGLLPSLRAYVELQRNDDMGRAPNPLTGQSLFLRPGTTDQDVYDEIFVEQEYDLPIADPRFIIDAGAHIGLSAVFFADKYPQATVVAIEPEPSNFAILERNAKDHPGIKPISAGLWSRKTHLRIKDSDVPTWSFCVTEDPSGVGIPALSILDILDRFNVTQIDVLKMDIEGSEVEVLNNALPWMDAVKVLIIELHDRFRPGCTEALERALSGRQYERSRSGESIVITNIHRKQGAFSSP